MLGFALAAAAANLIRAMLYGVSPFDPTAFVTTAGILVAVAGRCGAASGAVRAAGKSRVSVARRVTA